MVKAQGVTVGRLQKILGRYNLGEMHGKLGQAWAGLELGSVGNKRKKEKRDKKLFRILSKDVNALRTDENMVCCDLVSQCLNLFDYRTNQMPTPAEQDEAEMGMGIRDLNMKDEA